MNKLLIIGAGGHGKVCAEIAKKMNKWDEIAFLDDVKKGYVLDFHIIGDTKNISQYKNNYEVFVAVGDNKTRKIILEKINKEGFKIPNLVDKSAIISESVIMKKGNVIMPGVVINSQTKIGSGTIINTNTSIDHDCNIEDYTHISPGTTISGTVTIGNGTWIGAGATLIHNIKIGSNAVIGAGSVVINDIPNDDVVVGVPAKKIKENTIL